MHFLREFTPLEDLNTVDLVRHLLDEQHLITAEHTLKYWPQELYLPGPTVDRVNRETWMNQGGLSLQQRAHHEVEKRLAAYQPVETDPAIEAELRRIIRSGLTADAPLPEIPAPAVAAPAGDSPGRRSRRRSKEGVN